MLKTEDYWENGKGKTFHLLHFDSPYSLVTCTEDLDKQKKICISNGKHEDARQEKTWRYGTEFKGVSETSNALRRGDMSDRIIKEILIKKSKIMELDSVKSILRQAESLKRKRIYKDEGSELCIDRILCGDSNHWVKLTQGRKNKVVRLAVNYAMSAVNDETKFIELASLIAISSEIISVAGLSLEILALAVAHNITDEVSEGGLVFPLKTSSEPLDLRKVCCIGIPGLFRCFTFDIYRNLLKGTPDSGLGRPSGTSDKIKNRLEINYLFENGWQNEEQHVIIIDKLFQSLIN